MQWHGIKIHMVVLSVVVALAAFLGAHWLYNNLNFREPLKNELDTHSQVTDYRIDDMEDGSYQVVVTIKDTDNLMLTYRDIYQPVKEVMGNRQFTVKLVDQRDDLLNDNYNRGQFAIQEALVRGNFREMANVLDQSARETGVESRVFIDENNIYWQMRHGDYYLYEVIPRLLSPGPVPGDAAMGRG